MTTLAARHEEWKIALPLLRHHRRKQPRQHLMHPPKTFTTAEGMHRRGSENRAEDRGGRREGRDLRE